MMFDRKRAPEKAAPEEKAASPSTAPPSIAAAAAGNAASLDALGGETPSGAGSELPHLDAISASFGEFDVSDTAFHGGDDGEDAAGAVGAYAFARGNDVVGEGDDEFTMAHEAAHVVQRRGGGPGDEEHANAVAERVVAGEPAEDLLSEVASPADQSHSDAADPLKYTDNDGHDHAIDITTLTEAECWDYLQQNPTPGQRYGQKTFEEGDKAALELRFAATAGSTLSGLVQAMRAGGLPALALNRKFGKSVDEFEDLLDTVGRHAKVKNIDAWLFGNGPKMIANADNLLDFVNELREIERRADACPDGQMVDVAEQAIPNTVQTADIGTAAGLIEIKTVREPIQRPNDLGDQLSAGFGKFAAANGGEVVVYASYDEDTVDEDNGRGMTKKRKWDRPNGRRATETWAGGILRATTYETMADYLTEYLGRAGGGRDTATKLEVRMQNGKAFSCTGNAGVWAVA